MVAPSGEQYEITGGGYRAVVTECGAGLRLLEYDGQQLVAGYGLDVMAPSGSGQLLLPWPNRIEDGRYTFDGTEQQLALSEPSRSNASHGLTRWCSWTLEEQTEHSVSLVYRLMAQKGYPWALDLHALYDLSADGLTVTVTATNLSASPAPFAQGAHPYLSVGGDGIDGWELTLPASDRVTVDSRMIPSGREPVDETGYDFRRPRPLKDVTLDTAFTDLRREPDGRAEILLQNPAADRAVALWMDAQHGWVQVYTGDDLGDRARRAVAIEPMTAPPNAFRTGEDLVVLAPAGSDGDEHSSSWGINVL
jgi:aldose 1-epimerase